VPKWYEILEMLGTPAKMNNLTKHHGAGPPEARGQMQPHRLRRFMAGRASTKSVL